MTASTLRWPLLALIGLLVAVAVGLLATQLVSERIGISSEPITAGESLTPRHEGTRHARKRPPPPVTTTPAQTTSTAPGYTGRAPSSAGSSGASGSGGSEGGDSARGGLKPSTSPPGDSSHAPSAPAGGGTGTTTKPEPGDD